MRFAGNVIWFVLGGAITALFWLIGAAIFAISIIGLPLTRAAVEMAKLSAWPFGRDVVHVRELDERGLTAGTAFTGTIGFIFNVLWALTFGLALFLGYLVIGILYCITLIGIPFGLQAFKLAGISLWPIGRRVVTNELAREMRTGQARTRLAGYRQREPEVARPSDPPPQRITPRLTAPAAATLEPARTKLPPQLATDAGWFIEVVGEASYQPALEAATAAATGNYEGAPLVMVTLEPEDENRHDPEAVRVAWRGRTVGYLPRPTARQYRAALGARAATCSGMIVGGFVDEDDQAVLFGVYLNAAWPPRYK